MTLPNFFIVGAPKAGTDELYYQLDQHPQIYMSPLKEPCFFSSEVRVENFEANLQPQAHIAAESLREYLESGMPGKRFGGIISSLPDYERLFLRAKDEAAVGEGSVCYLWSRSAASAIASMIPQARIIIILMDPAERAFHQYLKSLSDGNVTHSFRTHVELALRDKREKMSVYHPFLEFGNYAEQIRRYMARVPAEQIHISLYEDRQADPVGWFKSILRFLGVDDAFMPHPVESPSKPHFERPNALGSAVKLLKRKPAVGRWVPAPLRSKIKRHLYAGEERFTCAPEDRAMLIHFYQEDILELRQILGRDLSGWLQY